MNDNITEHQRTINILERFNIYQEVLLSIIYRLTPIKYYLEPVYWYINTVFGLHGMLVSALFVTSWILSGSWLSGMLAALFYIFNKADTTRVSFVIPLRESFSLPFLWLQLCAVTMYLRSNISPKMEKACLWVISFSTFAFCVCWQFNQFVILLQAFALFGVWTLDMAPPYKIKMMYGVHVLSLLAVCCLQFFNKMILASLVMSFIPAAFIVVSITNNKYGSIVWRCMKLLLQIVSTFVIMALINYIIKFVIRQEADEHIYKFLLAKFGISKTLDFDVNLYLCNGAFEFLTFDTFERLSATFLFPLYVIVELGLLGLLAVAVCQNWSKERTEDKKEENTLGHILSDRPELAYHAIQSVFFGLIGLMTLRMKYLWTPHMCILASFVLGDEGLWTNVLERIKVRSSAVIQTLRHSTTAITIGILLFTSMSNVYNELADLKEFYDPDTVELMQWINGNTAPREAFTGSMQLLAGVKLSTGRPLLNHPHYEDKVLRQRTKELYQIYGRKSPKEVYNILKKYDATYVILEDSICLAPSNGCRTPDHIDIVNGQVPDNGIAQVGLVRSTNPRFCDDIRYNKSQYSKYFKPVFMNKTFRIYKLLH